MDFSQPLVMGILNVTPDSFSDGGQFLSVDDALSRAIQMQEEGADIIDVGGESTRPGADPIGMDEEADRVLTVIEALKNVVSVPISVDTKKPAIMRAAVSAGAKMINDVNALEADGAVELISELGVPVCLMHANGDPRTMQENPTYRDVVQEVRCYLRQRVDACLSAGVEQKNIVIDPGFGFGKTVAHNYSLMKHLRELAFSELPIMIGVSRKSMIGALLNVQPRDRVAGGLALTAMAYGQGARIFRTHDVRETKQCLHVCAAVMGAD